MSSRRRLLFLLSTGFSALLLAFLYARDVPLRAGFGIDAYHHLSAVRELAKGELPPRHNLVAGFLPQGHYGPYLVALGAIARVTGASPKAVLYAAGVANLVLFLLAFHAVTMRLLGPGPAGWSVAAALLLWGPWPRPVMVWASWGWPGTTSLADAHNFFYPHQAGLVLLLTALALVLPEEEAATSPAAVDDRGPSRPSRRWRRNGVALLVAAALVATHPLTGLAFAVAVGALALSQLMPGTGSARRAGWLLLLPVAALGLASLWPYYPVLGLLRAFTLPALRAPVMPAQALANAPPPVVTIAPPLPILDTLGPAVVGLVFCLKLARQRRFFLPLWSAACLALAVFPLLPLHQRFLFYAALPLQIAATGLFDVAWRHGRGSQAGVLLLLGAGALSAGWRAEWLLEQERPDLTFVERLTPKDAVVLCDPATANGVAGLTGRKVVVPNNPDVFLMMLDGARRVRDVREFLEPRTPVETREAILRRWQASHVLVDRLADPGLPALPYPVLYDGGDYVLYDARP